MKAQTKAIVASVVVIALALSAVSGITYSWWSDTEQTNVTVNTGSLDVATSDYKLTLVTSSKTETLATGTSAPETIAISYGGTSATGVYELQGYGVDPTNLELTISYKATFTASVNYQYTIAASFPENIGTVGTATMDGTTTNLPVQKNGDVTPGSSITHVYEVSIKITSLPAGVTNATAVLKNFITQKAANVVEDFSGVTAGTAATIVSQAITDGSTTTTPVTVDFSSVPDGAAKLTTQITTVESEDAKTAKIDLKLTKADGTTAVDLDSQTSVSFTMDGYYTSVMYYNSSSSDYSQPSASFVYYKDGAVVTSPSGASDVDKTKITFVTDHFSEFVAYADAFPVKSEADLKAAINAGVPEMKLMEDLSLSSDIAVEGDVALDLNSKTITFATEDDDNGNWNIKIQEGAKLDVTGAQGSAMEFSKSWGFRVYGELTIDGDAAFSNEKEGDSVIVGTAGEGAKITINGGTFTAASQGQAVYTLDGGKIVINDGAFVDTREDLSKGWLLNMNNDRIGNASIIVYGGTFTNYDPSTGDDASKSGKTAKTFVAEGCMVIQSTDGSGNKVYKVDSPDVSLTVDGTTTYYISIEDAVAALNAGSGDSSAELKFLKDYTSASALKLTITKPVTVCSGSELTVKNVAWAINASSGTVGFSNLKFVTDSDSQTVEHIITIASGNTAAVSVSGCGFVSGCTYDNPNRTLAAIYSESGSGGSLNVSGSTFALATGITKDAKRHALELNSIGSVVLNGNTFTDISRPVNIKEVSSVVSSDNTFDMPSTSAYKVLKAYSLNGVIGTFEISGDEIDWKDAEGVNQYEVYINTTVNVKGTFITDKDVFVETATGSDAPVYFVVSGTAQIGGSLTAGVGFVQLGNTGSIIETAEKMSNVPVSGVADYTVQMTESSGFYRYALVSAQVTG